MFENEIAINQLQLALLQKVVADLPAESLFSRGAGHGHPPAWILGHLAVTGELGQQLLGGRLIHPEWLPLFGPGSSDRMDESTELSKSGLEQAVNAAYLGLQTLAAETLPDVVARPHEVELFQSTPITTVGHLVSLLLTNHFGFHLAQLSSCRRSLGHVALF